MRRTRKRPLPPTWSGPTARSRSGSCSALISFFFLSITVNVLSGGPRAVGDKQPYGLDVRRWLKRTSVQNIAHVGGRPVGGAGVPALVGWAAVTGSGRARGGGCCSRHRLRLDAAALLARSRCATAGITARPGSDAPVVRGPQETASRSCSYSLVLFGTSLLVPVASMGLVYAGAAVVLGGWFVWRALRLWRGPRRPSRCACSASRSSTSRLLFAAVAADALDRLTPTNTDLPHTPVAPCEHRVVHRGGGPDDRVPARAVRRRRRGSFPATWLLMLFLGNVGVNASFWGAPPAGILMTFFVAGTGGLSRTV